MPATPPDKIPCVSIGMPVYNDVTYIREALESLLSQSFTDFELVISDNASTDGTGTVCEEYARRDPRIIYIRQEGNIGAISNFNFVLRKARGEFFMWAASDDVWDLDFIKLMAEALRNNEKAVLAFSPYLDMDEHGKMLGHKAVDYSTSHALWRLIKFCYRYNDSCTYGLYRTKSLLQVEFPRWKWLYEKTPLNSAYPVLCHVFSQGDFVLAGSKPLWFNRVYLNRENVARRGIYVAMSSNLFVNYIASIVHKANVMVVCVKYVHLGAHSIVLSFFSFFPLLLRCVYDCAYITARFAWNLLKRMIGARK